MASINVIDRIRLSVEKYPDRPALEIGSQQWSYAELWTSAGKIAEAVEKGEVRGNGPVALFAARSFATYAGLLGILLSGRAYLPMNLKFPASRAVRMMQLAGSEILVLSEEFKGYFQSVALDMEDHCLIVTIADEAGQEHIRFHSDYRKQNAGVEVSQTNVHPASPENFSEIAYLLFTSGTTGEPKGIPVSHGNLDAYLEYITAHYDIGPKDRCSQAFDTTFDLSVHDIFVCWTAGACLCPLKEDDLLLPNHFITAKQLTIWFSVPSIALRMKQVRMLKPDTFPLLRYSFFCGEALPNHLADDWGNAAPHSHVVNLYGPTEATISISEHEWDREKSPALTANGVVPIGKVFPTHRYNVVDKDFHSIPRGEEGELLVSGPQVTSGYLNSPEKTAENYIQLPQDDSVWYRTGDRVIELEDGTLQFLGRLDHQIQIRGFRVEAAEVESTIRNVEGVIEAVVLPNEENDGVVNGLRGFILINDGEGLPERVLKYCREKLPDYMVPTRVIILDTFPINANGKIDRKLLAAMENRNDA